MVSLDVGFRSGHYAAVDQILDCVIPDEEKRNVVDEVCIVWNYHREVGRDGGKRGEASEGTIYRCVRRRAERTHDQVLMSSSFHKAGNTSHKNFVF
jgi:hypothetical protein